MFTVDYLNYNFEYLIVLKNYEKPNSTKKMGDDIKTIRWTSTTFMVIFNILQKKFYNKIL